MAISKEEAKVYETDAGSNKSYAIAYVTIVRDPKACLRDLIMSKDAPPELLPYYRFVKRC